jgi:hypothetical protein
MCCGGSRTERESKGRSCRTQLKTRCKETDLNNQNTFDSLQSLPLITVHEFRAFFVNSCVASAVKWKILVMREAGIQLQGSALSALEDCSLLSPRPPLNALAIMAIQLAPWKRQSPALFFPLSRPLSSHFSADANMQERRVFSIIESLEQQLTQKYFDPGSGSCTFHTWSTP